jgi:hypothetical protein
MIVIQGGLDVNQFSQQPGNYQGQQSYLNQNAHYEPVGNVQSHYQGQLSQPTFGRETNSIVANSPGGYQSSNAYSQGAQMQHYAPNSYSNMTHPVGTNNSFMSHQPVQSYAGSPAMAFGNVGPVIAHVGYQAGSENNQHSMYQPTSNNGSQYAQHAAPHYGGYVQSHFQNGYGGMTQTHSNTSLHPVYEATNAYQNAGPVISRVGWQSTSAVNSSPYSGGMR